MKNCPFCNPEPDRVIIETELVVGLWDGYPVAPGHALLVPRRHVSDWSSASREEQAELCNAISDVQHIIAQRYQTDGYNIGINSGDAAGQTIPHLHVHVIPRYAGDVKDPRGGLRWVIPNKADYWSDPG